MKEVGIMEKNIDNGVEELKAQCICPGCPSYVNCGEPIAFCLIGISKCIKTEQGCICPGCPVYEKKGFNRDYFCLR
jgi:hypothetical protein